jgi:hypothetical protein
MKPNAKELLCPGTTTSICTTARSVASKSLTRALSKSRDLAVWDENEIPDTFDDAAEARATDNAHQRFLKAFGDQRFDSLQGFSERGIRIFWHERN